MSTVYASDRSKFSHGDWKKGQRVRLRGGTELEVTDVWSDTSYFPVRCGGDGWTSSGCWTRTGRSWMGGGSYSLDEHDKDIVEIVSQPRAKSCTSCKC